MNFRFRETLSIIHKKSGKERDFPILFRFITGETFPAVILQIYLQAVDDFLVDLAHPFYIYLIFLSVIGHQSVYLSFDIGRLGIYSS